VSELFIAVSWCVVGPTYKVDRSHKLPWGQGTQPVAMLPLQGSNQTNAGTDNECYYLVVRMGKLCLRFIPYDSYISFGCYATGCLSDFGFSFYVIVFSCTSMRISHCADEAYLWKIWKDFHFCIFISVYSYAASSLLLNWWTQIKNRFTTAWSQHFVMYLPVLKMILTQFKHVEVG